MASSAAASAQTDFSSFDLNRNNIITTDEYLDVIMAPFERLDTNANGWLSAEELMVAARQRAEGTRRKPRQMVIRLLQRFDSNSDGRLSALELGFGGSGEFFNLFDLDMDGSVTLAEWQSKSPAPAQTTTEPLASEDGPTGTTDTPPQETMENGRPIVPRTPTEPSEPKNPNGWKTDGIPDITSTQPMTGNWLFDLRP